MKRSEFFKSLLGLAIAPIVIKEVVENPWPEKLADSETVTAEVTPILREMPFFPQGGTISTSWEVLGETSDGRFIMNPNSDPPMSQEEYEKGIREFHKRWNEKT